MIPIDSEVMMVDTNQLKYILHDTWASPPLLLEISSIFWHNFKNKKVKMRTTFSAIIKRKNIFLKEPF